MNIFEIPDKAIRLVNRFFEKLGLETRFNAFHDTNRIVRQVLHAALGGYSIESGCKILKVQLPSNEVASADIILGHLHNLSPEKMQLQLQANIRQARNYAKEHYKNPVKIAIDFHEDEYYGDKNDPHVVGTQHKNGTNYAWRYITAEIVEKGKRLCIACEPVYSDDEKPVVLARILEQVKRIVKIEVVLVDRGFYGVECIRTLKKARLLFIMPVVKDKKMKPLMNEHSLELPWVGAYVLREKDGETFTLCLKREGDKIYGFATNIPFEGCGKDEMEKFVEDIAQTYDSRWGIETGYRVKNFFKARTTTRDHKIRQLYFFLSVILFNAWILTNQLLEKPITVFLFKLLLEKKIVYTNFTSVTHPP